MHPHYPVVHVRTYFFISRNLITIFFVTVVSAYTYSQESRIYPTSEVRSARRRVDIEEEKKDGKDSSRVKLNREHKKQSPEEKRKPKAVYQPRQQSTLLASLEKNEHLK